MARRSLLLHAGSRRRRHWIIDAGRGGAHQQLRAPARHLPVMSINHGNEYDQLIGEVRRDELGHALPSGPESDRVVRLCGYLVLDGSSC
ncbi:MAG: hypothetical protein ACYCV7_01670 [Acidimicrobiales bacterium]